MLSRRALTIAAAAVAFALAAPAGAQAADCAGADLVPEASNLGPVGQATLCLLNAERGAHGLRPLAEEPGLTAPSRAYSARMVAEHFFAHDAPDGSTLVDRLTAVGYIAPDGDWTVGENIAWGQGHLSTPRSIVAAWMASPGHRKNVLTPEYTEIGLGVVPGTPGDATWGATYTTDFGAVQRSGAGATMTPASATASRTPRRAAARTAKSCKKTTRTSARAAKARGRVAKRAKKGARKAVRAKRASTSCSAAPRARRKAA